MASLSESCTAEPSDVHRLVIVEGIMGSGKSTTMRFIAKHLQEAARPALDIHERTEPHPVRATAELEHWFEPWRDTTPEGLADRALAKWTGFVEYTQSSTDIPVLDGQLFHGDLTHLLLMEADTALIWGLQPEAGNSHRSAESVRCLPLAGRCRRSHQNGLRRARSRMDRYHVNWKLAAPYCVRRGFVGLDGLISLYCDYRHFTDGLFQELPLAKLAIESSGRDWPTYENRILRKLRLPTGKGRGQ
ncbi:hypothetical protein [Caballeronia sp. 15711]|uniref:hypothetical protein n=1 Tax=Caballeronia sp. 15711 TaxID=3391029 RepID=UPI0039E5624F